MNSLAIWFRSFFSWVLVVDSPPYPYESWRDLPEAQWPAGYDPHTDSFVQVPSTQPTASGQSVVGAATALSGIGLHAVSQLRKRAARKQPEKQFLAHQ